MNKNNAPDYVAVLADLRTRRAQLDAAIQALELVVGIPVGATPAPKPKAPPSRPMAAGGSFAGLSLIDATKKHLQRTGHCLRTTEILSALQQGGVALTGKSPINGLGAILNSNLKKGCGIVRERRGVWALAEWQTPRADGLNGSHRVELDRLLGAARATQRPADQPGLPPTSPAILIPSPTPAAAQHA